MGRCHGRALSWVSTHSWVGAHVRSLAHVAASPPPQVLNGTLKSGMKSLADSQGASRSAGNLNNMLMQMRKIANHPDLVTGPFNGDTMLPEAEEMLRQSGKLQLLERLLKKLKEGGHKVGGGTRRVEGPPRGRGGVHARGFTWCAGVRLSGEAHPTQHHPLHDRQDPNRPLTLPLPLPPPPTTTPRSSSSAR